MGKNKSSSNSVIVINGEFPVILTAPHSRPHRRPSFTGVLKMEEVNTDYIVRSVCSETNSWGVYLDSNPQYDPNYHTIQNNPFKKKIRTIVKKNKVEYLIDIHGLSDSHRYDVGIFYKTGFGRSKKLCFHIAQELNKGKLRGALITTLNFRDDDQETIGEYSSKDLKIPSIQLEIARYIRDDSVLIEEFIKNLSTAVRSL